MNLGMSLLLFVVVAGAVMGLAFIGSQATGNTVVDTYGAGLSNQTNDTMNATQGMLATGQQVGGGVIIFVALILAAIVLLALAAVAARKF